MSKKYTQEQMDLWGQFSIALGFTVVVSIFMIMEFLDMYLPPFYKLILALVLVVVTYLYHRLYQKTKEPIE